MCYRNPQIGGHPDSRGDAGHDLKGDTSLFQSRSLLASSPKHKGIPPLQTDHLLPFPGFSHQDLVDLLLGNGVMAGPLAHIDIPGMSAAPHEDAVSHQPVVHDHFRLLKKAFPLYCDQLHI